MKTKKPFFAMTLLSLALSACGGPASHSLIPSSGEDSQGGTSQSTSQGGGGNNSNTSQGGTSQNSSVEDVPTPFDDLPAIDHIQVFCPSNYTKIWAWEDGPVNLFEAWPGADLEVFNEDWKTYVFEDHTSINLLFSENGNPQTSDLKATHAGYWWFYNNKFGDENPLKNQGGGGLGGEFVPSPTTSVTQVQSAKDYTEFPLWNELPASNWKVLSPYTGKRDDFRDESIYFAITTRFYDGDTGNNVHCWDDAKAQNPDSDPAWRGDFKGLIEKMDYIKALGFTAIWITPVVENASGYDYHGYHALNFSKVDQRYKSEDVDFIDVIRAAHSRDMKIILDVVFNHTGNFGEERLFPLFQKDESDPSIQGMHPVDNGLLPSNYASLNADAQYKARINAMKSDVNDPGQIYHHSDEMVYEQYAEQTGQMAGDCVDLNTENPTVANYLVQCYGEFIRMGVDAFRIDTVKHISRLTFNKYIWPGLYHYAEKCGNHHFFMFGEVCTRYRQVWNAGHACDSAPFYTWKESKDYPWGTTSTNMASTLSNWNDNYTDQGQPTTSNAYLNGVSYHAPDHSRWSGTSVIDFPMHWNFQHARDAYNLAKGTDSFYNDATYNVVYVDSHDYGPDGQEKYRYKGSLDEWAENMNLMFTFRGVPCIFYGSEVQFKNDMEIDVGPNKPLEKTGRAYYGGYLEGEVSASGFGDYTASGTVKSTLEATLSKHLIKLNKIRQKVPALRRGQYKTYGDGMSFIRRYTSGNIDSLAVVSISGGASFSGLPNGTYVDLVSGDRKSVSSGNLTTSQSGQGSLRVYVLENSSTGTLSKIGESLTYLK